MTQQQIYQSYLQVVSSSSPLPPEKLLAFPSVNIDIFEDDSRVVNRLYYVLPNSYNATSDLFIFFEENSFLKDASGDLSLSSSTFHLLHP